MGFAVSLVSSFIRFLSRGEEDRLFLTLTAGTSLTNSPIPLHRHLDFFKRRRVAAAQVAPPLAANAVPDARDIFFSRSPRENSLLVSPLLRMSGKT